MPPTIPLRVLIWGLVKKAFSGIRLCLSWSFSAILWLLVVPLLTTQIFNYYFGWNLHETLHSFLATQDLDDYVLEISLTVGFDVLQGFLMTGFTVFLVLAMLLVREFLLMINYDILTGNSIEAERSTERNVERDSERSVSDTAASVNSVRNDAAAGSVNSVRNDPVASVTQSDTNIVLPSVGSLRSPLSPTSPLVSPLSPTRRHSEFRTSATAAATPNSPGGNYWVEQAHPKEFRNYMKRRDLQRALMEAEQSQRPLDIDSYLNEAETTETDPLVQQPDDHVSNISGTTTLRSRYTHITTASNATTSNSHSRESFRCRICSSNTCTSREHVIQASQMRNTLTAQRNQAILQRQTESAGTGNTANTVNNVNNPQNPVTAEVPATNANPADTDNAGGWGFDAAENISFPEFFGFTLQGTPILQLLQNSAIVIGCNALFMHLFLFVPFITGRTFNNETVFAWIQGYAESSKFLVYTQPTWKYLALFTVEKGSLAEFTRNVLIGYSILCTVLSLYLRCTRGLRDTFNRTITPIFNFIAVFIKLLTLLFIEMVLFPLICGFMVDYFCLDLFPGSTLYSRLLSVRTLPISSLTIHWALGAFFMLNFASFVTFSRTFLRPGLLYFLRNPQDPDSHPVKEMVERSFPDQMYRLFISVAFYCALIYSSIGLTVKIITIPVISRFVFPLNFKFHEPLIEIPIDLLFHLLLRSLLSAFSPLKLFKSAYISLQKLLYRQLSLSSYFLGGGRYLAEESFPKGGSWVAVPDYDRQYSRKRLKEIRSRVITPVDIAKLKILYDKQNQPIMESGTSGSHATSKSDWTVVFRPNYFKLKCFLVLFSMLASLQVFLLTISIVPLISGRFIVKLVHKLTETAVEPIHEIYSWHIGAFALFLLVKLVEFFALPVKKARRLSRTASASANANDQESSPSFSEKMAILLVSTVKIAVIGFFVVLLWPLQVGILFSLLINPILNGNPLTTAQIQIPIMFIGTCWSIGFPILRILYTLRAHLPLPQTSHSYLSTSLSRINSLEQIQLKEFLKLVVFPVTLMFTLALIIPPALVLVLLPLSTTADTELLYMYQSSSHLLALTAYLTYKLGASLAWSLRKLVSGIRDETYLVGRRLHNLDQ